MICFDFQCLCKRLTWYLFSKCGPCVTTTKEPCIVWEFYLSDVLSLLQEHAFESSQKYKEGKYIIELAHMIKDNGWDWHRSTAGIKSPSSSSSSSSSSGASRQQGYRCEEPAPSMCGLRCSSWCCSSTVVWQARRPPWCHGYYSL